MTLTSRQVENLNDLIYQALGLAFDDSKADFIQKRVEKRMALLGITRADDYVFHLRFLDGDGKEMQALANLVTTNETYMFREFDQLQAFADCCLPEVLQESEKRGRKVLRVWSAGCSSGEEPYTLAIILREVVHDIDTWDVRILATDIDEVRLEMARKATYGLRSVKEVPEAYMHRHIVELDADTYVVSPETTRLVEVRHLNLHDRIAMRGVRGMDFVFCRNVLIYFDDASRKDVVDRFFHALKPGGYLFLGHAESVGRISSAFALKRFGKHLVYRREP
jgi:chemotaxis protein methyltransferase CheR